jgi:hypothetical protein
MTKNATPAAAATSPSPAAPSVDDLSWLPLCTLKPTKKVSLPTSRDYNDWDTSKKFGNPKNWAIRKAPIKPDSLLHQWGKNLHRIISVLYEINFIPS